MSNWTANNIQSRANSKDRLYRADMLNIDLLGRTADTGEYINDAYSLAMFRHILNMELHMQLTHIHGHI
jgi:hypothetical protein